MQVGLSIQILQEENLSFDWKDITRGLRDEERLSLDPFETQQILELKKEGVHEIQLTISDGIESRDTTLVINVVAQPEVFVVENDFVFYNQSSLLKPFPTREISFSVNTFTSFSGNFPHETTLSLVGYPPVLELNRLLSQFEHPSWVELVEKWDLDTRFQKGDSTLVESLLAYIRVLDKSRPYLFRSERLIDFEKSFEDELRGIQEEDLTLQSLLDITSGGNQDASRFDIKGVIEPGRYSLEAQAGLNGIPISSAKKYVNVDYRLRPLGKIGFHSTYQQSDFDGSDTESDSLITQRDFFISPSIDIRLTDLLLLNLNIMRFNVEKTKIEDFHSLFLGFDLGRWASKTFSSKWFL